LNLWNGFWDTGIPNRQTQQFQLNYDIPLNKIPVLEFVNAQYSYTSNFEWQREGDAVQQVAGEEINTVQNANTHNITAELSMQRFYDYIGLKKRSGKTTASKAPNKNSGAAKGPAKESGATSGLFNVAVDVLTMLKRFNVNYSESNGKVLPGYLRSVGFIGTTKPTLGFVFGSQADVRFDAARKGWLTTFTDFNQQYMEVTNKQLNISATAQPIQDLTIDLVADRNYASNYQENFKVEEVLTDQYVYQNLLGNQSGNFSISTMMISTAFKKSDEFY